MKGNADVIRSYNNGIDLLLGAGVKAYYVGILKSLNLIIEDCEGCLHIGSDPEHTDSEEEQATKEYPTDKAEVELEELPTVALHKSFALVKALTPCEIGMVLLYVENKCV